MKKHDSGKESCGLFLYLLLKLDLCLPGEMIVFVKQMFLESNCRLHGFSKCPGPDAAVASQNGESNWLCRVDFPLGVFIFQAH